MAKRCALSTCNLLLGGLSRNSVDRITDRPDMTSAVYRGRKVSTQTNKQTNKQTARTSSIEAETNDKHRNLVRLNNCACAVDEQLTNVEN